MRQHKRVSLDIGGSPREFTVLELTVQDMLECFGEIASGGENLSVGDLFAKADEMLPKCVEGLSVDDLKTMAPSEIQAIYDEWHEVNATFFKMARKVGLAAFGAKIKEALIKDFYGLLSDSLNAATLTPSVTDGEPS